MNTRFEQPQRKLLPFEVKLADPDTTGQLAGTVEGYAAGIGNVDKVGDIILPGAFTQGLEKFLADGFIAFNHNWEMPIGRPIEAREDSYGLFTKGAISATTLGRDVMTLARDGVVTKMSIGYRVPKGGYQDVNRAELVTFLSTGPFPPDQQAAILNQFDQLGWGVCTLLSKINLFEYSLVTIPANSNASITSAKGGLLDGLSFDEHSAVVRAAVGEFWARVKEIRELRKGEGRDLSQSRKTLLSEHADALQSVVDELRSLAPAKSEATGNEIVPLVVVETLLSQARRSGVAV